MIDLEAARKAAREARELAAVRLPKEITCPRCLGHGVWGSSKCAFCNGHRRITVNAGDNTTINVPALAALVEEMAAEIERLKSAFNDQTAELGRANSELHELRPIALRAVEWCEATGHTRSVHDSERRLYDAVKAAGLLES